LTPRVIRNHAEANSVTSDYVDSITRTGKGRIRKDELIKRKPIMPVVPQEPAGDQVGVPQQPVPPFAPKGSNQPLLRAPQDSRTTSPAAPSGLPGGPPANPPGAVPPGAE